MVQVQDEKLQKIADRLKSEFQPVKLFFYGSRANGTHHEDSDYDFVMVLPQFDDKKRYEMMSSISSKFFKEFGIEVQVWTYSQHEFDFRKDDFSSIPETAMSTGIEIDLV